MLPTSSAVRLCLWDDRVAVMRRGKVRVGVVGPCASGKTTLAQRLRRLGYQVREPAQEHSGVPDMWQRLAQPDVLIFLDVSAAVIRERLNRRDWPQTYLAEQHRRLAHARAHCDLYIMTDGLTPDEVLHQALTFLRGITCM